MLTTITHPRLQGAISLHRRDRDCYKQLIALFLWIFHKNIFPTNDFDMIVKYFLMKSLFVNFFVINFYRFSNKTKNILLGCFLQHTVYLVFLAHPKTGVVWVNIWSILSERLFNALTKNVPMKDYKFLKLFLIVLRVPSG